MAAHVALLAPPQAPPAHLAADLRARLAADRAARPAGPRGAGGSARRRGWSMGMLAAAAAILVLAIAGALLLNRDEAPEAPLMPPATLYRQILGQEGASRFAVVPDEMKPHWRAGSAARRSRRACMTHLPALSTIRSSSG